MGRIISQRNSLPWCGSDSSGRHIGRKKTGKGSVFAGRMRLTLAEWEELCGAVRLLIPIVPLWFYGQLIPARQRGHEFETVLDTVLATEEGELRRSQRKTVVRLYEPLEGEAAMLYEMGIPIVQTGEPKMWSFTNSCAEPKFQRHHKTEETMKRAMEVMG